MQLQTNYFGKIPKSQSKDYPRFCDPVAVSGCMDGRRQCFASLRIEPRVAVARQDRSSSSRSSRTGADNVHLGTMPLRKVIHRPLKPPAKFWRQAHRKGLGAQNRV